MLHEVQQPVHPVQQVKEEAAQKQDQLCQPLELINAEKYCAVLQNTRSVKILSK